MTDFASIIDYLPLKMEVRVDSVFFCTNEVKILYGGSSKLRAEIGDWNSISPEKTLRWMLGKRN